MLRSTRFWLVAALALMPQGARASTSPIVFFDSGSSALSAQAEGVLDWGMEWLRWAEAEAIRIDAATDRVGSASANLRLSRRRGEAVKAALVRRGFPAERIEVRALGEAYPLVETADGLAHRDNRYAAVTITRMRSAPR